MMAPGETTFRNFLSEEDGRNWYAYVGNDPVNFVDPLGLLPETPGNGQAEEPEMIWPALGKVVGVFGEWNHPITGKKAFHKGIDIANQEGTPVIAAADGIVLDAGYNSDYGNYVILGHDEEGFGGVTTRYAHLKEPTVVKLNQELKQGDGLGIMGNTGKSTGSHLHFEVRINNEAVDPRQFIKGDSADPVLHRLPDGRLPISRGGQ